MSVKKRPDSARQEVRRQAAQVRRGAPGKRFIGGTAAQSAKARRAQARKVQRMAEAHAEARREEERIAAAQAEAVPEPDLEALGAAAPVAAAAVEAFPDAHPTRGEAAAPRSEPAITKILMGLVADAFHLARSLARAPFQIARALLRPAEA